MLWSTKSSASRCRSSFGPYKGDRGNAIRPVLVDSRIPKGAMSFIKESILDGFADLSQDQHISVSAFLITYNSTMQLLVLMSSTFPPNWCVR